MNKIILFGIIILLEACSLGMPRKSHYDYLKKGMTKKEVKEKSGEPDEKHLKDYEDLLTYGYCDVSWTAEALLGLITYGIYNTHCKINYKTINLRFQDDKLVEIKYHANKEEREAAIRRFAEGFSRGNNSSGRNNYQYNHNQNTQNAMDNIYRKETTTKCRKDGIGGVKCISR